MESGEGVDVGQSVMGAAGLVWMGRVQHTYVWVGGGRVEAKGVQPTHCTT